MRRFQSLKSSPYSPALPSPNCLAAKPAHHAYSSSLKNFKAWKDYGDIRLAPLTVLFGTNSAGKTSIPQLLLLLKQAANPQIESGHSISATAAHPSTWAPS